LHVFPSMFVSTLREFLETVFINIGGHLFSLIFAQKIIKVLSIFFHMILKMLKKKKRIECICILKQYISCSITIYLILAKNDQTFWYKSVISSVEVYDKHIITCHFSYHTLCQPSFIYHLLSLLGLRLIP
jgi:hypothetical protein